MILPYKINSLSANEGILTLTNGPYNILAYSLFGDKSTDPIITFFHGAAVYDFTSTHATETFTISGGHKLPNLHQVKLVGADLPNGLTAGTLYWIIWVSPTEFQLASSLANAVAGTEVTVSDDGTGSMTVSGYDFWSDQFDADEDAKVFTFPGKGLPSLGEVVPFDLTISIIGEQGIATAYILVEKI